MRDSYLIALRQEIADHHWEWTPDTVYVGGGTPSQLDPEDLASVLKLVPGFPWLEATIEASPGTITLSKAAAWSRAGINRVSLGVQSFVAEELAHTGRRHTAESVQRDCEHLRDAGIENINLDLIAGLPFQNAESWHESLRWVQRIDPPHVSIYLFEVDENSRLGAELLQQGSRYGARAVPDDEVTVQLYESAVRFLHGLGIERYEISNFARPGRESKHNLKYWTLQPYAGFGSDAHSFDGVSRYSNPELAIIYSNENIERQAAPADLPSERVFLGLRLAQGVGLEEQELALHASALQEFVDQGLVRLEGSRLCLTDRGMLLSNEVFEQFIP